ncbi:MAG: hypothetical protein FJX42_03050 [Alphaproteobacteria bacterium]|nr:hypothetical protein [Alphaproteobacteria bacterium]
MMQTRLLLSFLILACLIAAGPIPPAGAQTRGTNATPTPTPVPSRIEDPSSGSLTSDMYKDMKLGKLNIHGDNAVIEALVLQRDIPIAY